MPGRPVIYIACCNDGLSAAFVREENAKEFVLAKRDVLAVKGYAAAIREYWHVVEVEIADGEAFVTQKQ